MAASNSPYQTSERNMHTTTPKHRTGSPTDPYCSQRMGIVNPFHPDFQLWCNWTIGYSRMIDQVFTHWVKQLKPDACLVEGHGGNVGFLYHWNLKKSCRIY
jgi:hypothetical protein